MLTVTGIFDVCTLDYPTIDSEQSSTDAEL